MNIAQLLLVTTLILRSGQHFDVEGAIHEQSGRIIFRATSGALYSVPIEEIDVEATLSGAPTPSRMHAGEGAGAPLKLRLTADERKRLIADLEQNHNGQAAPAQQLVITAPPPEPSASSDDEWTWRRRARDYEEQIRRAKENRDLLVDRASQLRSHISGLISLGYKPSQFSYDTTQLQYTLEQIPYAELEIERSERAFAQFRDDARRMGVAPGWLR